MNLLARYSVQMNYYQHLDKESIPENIIGFLTPNVCDCVAGFITSDQGVAFFHFFKRNDPQDLGEKIKTDFKNATSIKITLIGGNLVPVFFPYKTKNREITESNYMFLLSRGGIEYSACVKREEITTIVKENIKSEIKDKNLETFDYSIIDQKISENEIWASLLYGACRFKVCGVKDFVGYQNIAKIFNALIETKLFTKENITHYHNPSSYNVIADFNGDIRTFRLFHELEINKCIPSPSPKKIAYMSTIT